MKRSLSLILLILLAVSAVAKSKRPILNRELSAMLNPLPKRFQEMLVEIPDHFFEPEELALFRHAYKDLVFSASFDEEKNDWKISITAPKTTKIDSELRTETFWWCGGRFLPEEELLNTDKYWTVLYNYPTTLEDPKDFDEEKIKRVREYSSQESRKNGAGTPPFFFDFLYSADSQRTIENHIVQVRFLGNRTKIHERIKAPLARVEEKIQQLSKTDEEVESFVESIKSSDAYHWRIIAGTNRKSFHSYGIAVDVLPRSLGGKAIFWSWEKDRNPNGWMLVPLAKRGMPPQPVIKIFEREGFVWGGKWGIWDNMHFEYHPELILHNFGMNAMD